MLCWSGRVCDTCQEGGRRDRREVHNLLARLESELPSSRKLRNAVHVSPSNPRCREWLVAGEKSGSLAVHNQGQERLERGISCRLCRRMDVRVQLDRKHHLELLRPIEAELNVSDARHQIGRAHV